MQDFFDNSKYLLHVPNLLTLCVGLSHDRPSTQNELKCHNRSNQLQKTRGLMGKDYDDNMETSSMLPWGKGGNFIKAWIGAKKNSLGKRRVYGF